MGARDDHRSLAALERHNSAYGPAATKVLDEVDRLRADLAAMTADRDELYAWARCELG